MRIVIDGRLWAESGIGRYIRNLVEQLQKLDNRNQYFILLLKKDFEKNKFRKNFTQILADFRWYGISEQLILPNLLKSLQPDLVHFPHFNVPILYKGKYVVTIHDLIHQHFQTKRATTHDFLTYKIKKLGYKRVFTKAIKNSEKIFSPSEFVKNQLITEWGIEKDKVIVTYEGVEGKFLEILKEVKMDDFKKISEKFNLQKPYLFYAGNAHPHKNIKFLIGAFLLIKEKHPNLNLVLSGPDNYFWNEIKKESNIGGGIFKGLIFTGFVSDKGLATLYNNAFAFIMPSLEEGFGIPVLEAMVCGCPVVSSNAASLPEVGGDAVIYFDPGNEEDIVSKVMQVLSDEKLRSDLIKKGEKRYKEFSWQKMAQQTLKVYQSTPGVEQVCTTGDTGS